MAKRNLGLGKVKAKKQKTENNEKAKSTDESNAKQEQLLTVELTDEVNPDDPLSQLCGLWKTWKNGERDNELILNGIINECDRLLRNNHENGGNENVKLNDNFYSIYSQALSDIAKFKPDEEIADWIDNSLERIDEGFGKFNNNNIRLLFTKCNVLLNKIAIQFIGKMNIDSKKEEYKELNHLFKEFFETWNKAIKECEKQKDFSIFKEEWVLEILNVYDDLLDIVDKFGTPMNEIVDSDGEEDEEEVEEEEEENENQLISKAKNDVLQATDFEIAEDHPLYEIRNDDSYNVFWRDNMLKYKELMGDDVSKNIKKSVHEKLGQSYLMEAEDPIAFFNSFQYDRDDEIEDALEDEEDKLRELVETKEAAEKSRELGKSLVNTAIEHLREAHDEEDPKTWVNVAEALITYANLLELESEEQEQTYKKAEKLLRRANNACHGKYQDILDSLIVND